MGDEGSWQQRVFFSVLSSSTSGRLFLQFNLEKYLSSFTLGQTELTSAGNETSFFLKHSDSPSAEEWEYLSMCGDNGVQTQSIRLKRKIAKRKKIKGNAWTLVLMLNQPFLSSLSPCLSPLLTMCREKRGEWFPDIHSSDTEWGETWKRWSRQGVARRRKD